MTVKNSLFDLICHRRHSVILMDSLDAGHRHAGSIFFRCFLFFSPFLMTLQKQGYPLLQTERWVVLFDILYCYMPVYKNANDNHRKGHLDYCRASLSCLFLSGLLSLHLFCNLSSLHLEFVMMKSWSEGYRASWCVCVCLNGWVFQARVYAYVSSIPALTESECDPWAVPCNQSACLALLSECSSSSPLKEPFLSPCGRPSLCPSLFSRLASLCGLSVSAILRMHLTGIYPRSAYYTVS